MNKIFRKVWRKSLGQLVVASELASSSSGTPTTKGRGFRASSLPIAAAIACVLAGTHAPSAQAASINLSGTCLTGVINTVVGRIVAGATLGQATDGNGTYSSVAGCSANGNNQLAVTVFGAHSSATDTGASALGFNATAARLASSIGIESRATGVGSAALGYGADASAINSVAIGGSASTGTTSLAAGDVTRSSGIGSIAIGANVTRGAQATANDAIAIGGQATAAGARTVAIGVNAQAALSTDADGVAIGSNTVVRSGSTAIGVGASAGQSTQTILNGGVAIGTQASTGTTSTRSVAIGAGAAVNAAGALDGGLAVGAAAAVTAANGIALGTGAAANQAGSVALGTGAVTDVATPTASVTLGGTTYGFAGSNPTSTVSVGSALNQRTVTNVAAGRLTLGSTDAVNGSQLNATNQALSLTGTLLGTIDDRLGLFGTNLAAGLGGASTYDPLTGALSTQLQVGATVHNTVQSALSQLNTTVAAGVNVTAQGSLINITPGQTLDFGNTDGNIVVSQPVGQDQLRFDLASDVNVANSVSVGTTEMTTEGVLVGPNVQLGNTGLTITGGPSVTSAGINAGGQALTNVGAGVLSTDAANVGQVNAVGAVANAGINVSAQGLNGTTAALNSTTGNAIDLRNTDGNLVVTKDTVSNNVSFDLADDVVFDSLTVGGTTTLDATGVAVGPNVRLGPTGLSIVGGPSVTSAGINAAGQVVGNVGAGIAATDAVNRGQLDAVSLAAGAGLNLSAQGANTTNVALGSVTGNTLDLNNTDGNLVITKSPTTNDVSFNLADDVAFDTLTVGGTTTLGPAGVAIGANVQLGTGGLTITGGPSVTLGGINAGGLTVGNVAAGVNVTDAVNLGQLQQVGNAANAGWNVAAQGANPTNVSTASTTGNTVDLNNTDGNLVITKTATSNNVTFNLADEVAFDRVAVGTTVVDANGVAVGPNVQLSDTGLAIAGGASVTSAGLNAGNQAVTNVANGTNATDAVNLGQLQQVGSVAAAGLNVSAQGTNATNVSVASATGNSIDFKNTDGNVSITKDATSNDLTFNLAPNLAFDTLTVGGTTTLGPAGLTVGTGVQVGPTGLVIQGGPSVTTGGVDAGGQAVRNVAAGTQGTDAVNVNQLNQAMQGSGSSRYYSINSTGGTNQVNEGATGTDAMAVGKSASAEGDTAVAIGLETVSAGDRAVSIGAGARAEEDDSLALGAGAVATHTNSIALGAGSITTVGARVGYQAAFVGPSTSAGEVNIGNRQLTGLAAGSAPGDAATVGQVEAGVNQAVATSQAYTDGQVSAISASVDGLNTSVGQLNDRVDTVEGNLGAIQGDVAGLNGRVTGVEQALADLGDVTLFDDRVDDLENGAAGVSQVSQEGPVVAAQATGTNSMAVGNGAVASGANASALGNQANASGSNSTAVGQGASATGANSTALGQGATAAADNSTAVGQGATVTHANSVALGAGSATTVGAQANYNAAYVGPSSSVGEVNIGGRTFSGVAPGVAGTDAVNVNQLNGGVNQAVSTANAYTDNRIDALKQDTWTLKKDMRGATASAMAMAGIPQAYTPGRSFVGVGVGGYQGEYGMAVGMSTITESGRYIYKIQASGNTSREWGFSVGAGIQW